MKTIGIYAGHDQGAAAVEDGRVLLAMEEERPTRRKHAEPPPHHPGETLAWLAGQGHTLQDADRVALADPLPHQGALRDGIASVELDVALEPKVRLVEHHLAHAALGVAWSGWDDCHVLVIDGGGSVSYALAARAVGGRLEEIARDDMANARSIMNPGLFYLLCTQALGFKPVRDEGKVMCLAARGDKARFPRLFHDRYEVKPFEVTDRRMPGAERKDGTWTPSRDAIREIIGVDPQDESVRADVAAQVQDFFEHLVWTDVRAHVPRGCRLALAGGCFASVTINRQLLDWASEVFVAPAMNDGGLAAGAALYAEQDGLLRPYRVPHVYLGHDAGESSADPRQVARRLANGATVGVCQGRSEYGPRALGHRSILADPRDPQMPAKVGGQLRRDLFMPFAPVMLDEEADRILEPTWRRAAHAAEFMTVAFAVQEGWRERLPAVVHVDGTCRPQVLREEVNPFVYAVLREFKAITGVGVLLNTSFNRHGLPIIHGAEDALDHLAEGCADELVLGRGGEIDG